MRIVAADRHGERIAVASTSTADALQVVGLLRRHGRLKDSGEVANVDAHLERWRGREEIDVPRLVSLAEAVLDQTALGALDVARMLPRRRACGSAEIEPRGLLDVLDEVFATAAALGEARHLAPETGIFGRNERPSAAVSADGLLELARDGPGGRIEQVDGGCIGRRHVHDVHEPCLRQHVEKTCIGFVDGGKHIILVVGG